MGNDSGEVRFGGHVRGRDVWFLRGRGEEVLLCEEVQGGLVAVFFSLRSSVWLPVAGWRFCCSCSSSRAIVLWGGCWERRPRILRKGQLWLSSNRLLVSLAFRCCFKPVTAIAAIILSARGVWTRPGLDMPPHEEAVNGMTDDKYLRASTLDPSGATGLISSSFCRRYSS